MWSEISAVQVMVYRILKSISNEGWPQDLLDMLYLDDETKVWAEETKDDKNIVTTLDSNGTILDYETTAQYKLPIDTQREVYFWAIFAR